MKLFFLTFLFAFSLFASQSVNDINSSETNATVKKTGYDVTLYGHNIFQIYEPIGIFSAKQRAEEVSKTLTKISKKSDLNTSALTSLCQGETCVIDYQGMSITAITTLDANESNKTLDTYSAEILTTLQVALAKAHNNHETSYILRQVGIVAGMLVTLITFLFLLSKGFAYLYTKLRDASSFKTLQVRSVVLLKEQTTRTFTITLVKLIHLTFFLLAVYYFMVIGLELLPWTEDINAAPLLQNVMWIIFSTLITLFMVRSTSMIHISILQKIIESKKRLFKPMELGGLTLLSVEKEMELITFTVRILMFAFVIFVIYSYITFIFSLFEFTKTWAQTLIVYVTTPVKVMVKALVGFIPNIFYIVVIVYAFRYLLKMVHYIFAEIDSGNLTFGGFYSDWAMPTYGVVRVMIILFAAIVIFPYLPGSNSPFFQGISIFMGLLLSMGSSSAIANIVAGIVLIYMRPFKIGDRVKIADTVGDVIEKTFLVTRIRTIKNADITIPNSSVLGGHIINYSSSATETGLILNTTITIGYDVPWRQVHELMLSAANGTEDILFYPSPFILQTSLDDFYVSYELNAYTDKPWKMARTYSDLHAAIQDKFNEAGVEIMSPHYSTLRDGNEVTIPASYRPENYSSPTFGIRINKDNI